jgi:hypothetical protein
MLQLSDFPNILLDTMEIQQPFYLDIARLGHIPYDYQQ